MKNELVNKETTLGEELEHFGELIRRAMILANPNFKLTDIDWETTHDDNDRPSND